MNREFATHFQSLPRQPPTLEGVTVGDIPIKFMSKQVKAPYNPIPLDCNSEQFAHMMNNCKKTTEQESLALHGQLT